MRRVYFSHAYSADPAANIPRAKRWLRWAYQAHPTIVPVAGWILLAELHPTMPYDVAMRHCFCELATCGALWLVGGHLSPGMQREEAFARSLALEVVSLLEMGSEPPEGNA